jgi:hypothetical protein
VVDDVCEMNLRAGRERTPGLKLLARLMSDLGLPIVALGTSGAQFGQLGTRFEHLAMEAPFGQRAQEGPRGPRYCVAHGAGHGPSDVNGSHAAI